MKLLERIPRRAAPRVFLAFAAACGAALAQASQPAPALGELLAKASAEQRPDARAKAAAALSARPEPVEAWLDAMRSFGSFTNVSPGEHEYDISLWNGAAAVGYRVIVYVPRSYNTAAPAPLCVALHGSGGAAEEMIAMWRPAAEAAGWVLVANTEPLAKDGYTFKPEERNAALSMIRWARLNFNINENLIFCTGVSRGGHLAWDTALRYPDLYASIAPMIGGPWAVPSGGRNNLRYLPSIAHLPIRDLQGSQDDPGLVALLRYAFKKLKELKAKDAELIEFPELGHSFRMGAVDWQQFVASRPRDPIPASATVTTVRKNDAARAFWAEVLGVAKDVQEEFKTTLTKAEANKVNALDPHARSQWWSEQAEKHTARLDVSMPEAGRFVAKGTGVAKFRILLTETMFDPKKSVQVAFNGKSKNHNVKPDKRILISEFVERFDRTFLPIAEARVE